ncbi:MAG TPA: HNH endonuclease [Burkholderiales bacterium]
MPTKPLDRLLFAQGGQCFFCEKTLPVADASVEHLVASARGGNNADENCVVCCKAMNALLGSMSLKEKMKVVLKQKGEFHCPNGQAKKAKAPDMVALIAANLRQRGSAKPKSVKALSGTIRSLSSRPMTDSEVDVLVAKLKAKGMLSISGTKVTYTETDN